MHPAKILFIGLQRKTGEFGIVTQQIVMVGTIVNDDEMMIRVIVLKIFCPCFFLFGRGIIDLFAVAEDNGQNVNTASSI